MSLALVQQGPSLALRHSGRSSLPVPSLPTHPPSPLTSNALCMNTGDHVMWTSPFGLGGFLFCGLRLACLSLDGTSQGSCEYGCNQGIKVSFVGRTALLQ